MCFWRSVKFYGMPESKEIVIVTVESESGTRYVDLPIRFLSKQVMKEEGYTDGFISKCPDGVWEWAYEIGADYWEVFYPKVIAWAYLDDIQPYIGE